MAAVTQNGTRKITTGAGGYTNVDLYHQVYCSFPVTSDTGAVDGAVVTGARLYISRFKSYVSTYYLEVSFGGGVLAVTPNFTQNESSHSATVTLSDLSDGLLTDAASSVVLNVIKTNSTTGPKINFRDGCTLTLEIDYAPASGGGGSTGGGGSSSTTGYCEAATNLELSANKSYGEDVTLSWIYPGETYNTKSMLILAEYSQDGETWEAAVELTDDILWSCIDIYARPYVCKYPVPPPPVVWAYYRFKIETRGQFNRLFSEYSEPLQYVRPVLVPYTDDPIVARVTNVKAVHMTELQTNINRIRDAEKLAAYEFTPIVSGRTALADWSEHVNELRSAIDEMDVEHEAWILFDVNAPRADVIEQLRRVVAAI